MHHFRYVRVRQRMASVLGDQHERLPLNELAARSTFRLLRAPAQETCPMRVRAPRARRPARGTLWLREPAACCATNGCLTGFPRQRLAPLGGTTRASPPAWKRRKRRSVGLVWSSALISCTPGVTNRRGARRDMGQCMAGGCWFPPVKGFVHRHPTPSTLDSAGRGSSLTRLV